MPNDNLQKTLQSINEKLSFHGGGVSLTEFDADKKNVKLKFQGACQGCPMAKMTSENFVKKELKAKMPELKSIEII